MRQLNNNLMNLNKIKNGKKIKHIFYEAYKILGNPLILFDTEYNLLAYTDVFTDDPVFNEIISYGNFSYETQKFFMQEGFVDSVANTKTITFMRSDKLKYERICGKLYNKEHLHIACLVVLASNRHFNDNDPTVFKTICEALTKEFSKSEFYRSYGLIYQETYIKKLIDGNIDEKALYTAHIEILYTDLKTNLYLAVVDTSRSDLEYTGLSKIKNILKKAQPEFKYAIYSNYILIVMSTDETNLNVNKDLDKLHRLFKKHNIYAGISSSFENMFELQKYYQEALSVLGYGIEMGDQRIFTYDQLRK